MNIKKVMALSLATCIAASPLAVKAEEEIRLISAPINAPIDEAIITEYIEFKGKIEKVEKENDILSIIVKNDNAEGLDQMKAYINEDVILISDKTMNFTDKEDLKEGMEVTIFYHKDTIMTMSYPPMLGPDVVVINDNEEHQGVMVSKYDEELLSAEGDMILRPSEETIIVDKDGEALGIEDLANRDLIVFTDIVLLSYPGQTSPEKIIVMPEREEIAEVDEEEVVEEVEEKEFKEFILGNEFIKEINGVKMIPLRLVGESLGYEITWNQETKTTELTRGAQWTAVTIGKDNYNFARMLIKLGAAPVLVESDTYVPENFIEEVLKAKVEILPEGLKILY
ncbi:copper amine oxidase N-terminal domain-containing protein [Tissierella sp. Yu-01]|uniref:copper amine oxidase N-terminal domain-containing protein n=1 Tax=Tissierella sp. Yu-01 TaxID=3035694 RepID=UPI00240E1289|nr:copper amine oxidase N-terminal domain-containing protein [Tissierella sp. Yu-01]WFA07758.1 copper amine oxidase N-terminal domain-containing protein [Tissierella sp. Yu-01]